MLNAQSLLKNQKLTFLPACAAWAADEAEEAPEPSAATAAAADEAVAGYPEEAAAAGAAVEGSLFQMINDFATTRKASWASGAMQAALYASCRVQMCRTCGWRRGLARPGLACLLVSYRTLAHAGRGFAH